MISAICPNKKRSRTEDKDDPNMKHSNENSSNNDDKEAQKRNIQNRRYIKIQPEQVRYLEQQREVIRREQRNKQGMMDDDDEAHGSICDNVNIDTGKQQQNEQKEKNLYELDGCSFDKFPSSSNAIILQKKNPFLESCSTRTSSTVTPSPPKSQNRQVSVLLQQHDDTHIQLAKQNEIEIDKAMQQLEDECTMLQLLQNSSNGYNFQSIIDLVSLKISQHHLNYGVFGNPDILRQIIQDCDILTLFRMKSINKEWNSICSRIIAERTNPALVRGYDDNQLHADLGYVFHMENLHFRKRLRRNDLIRPELLIFSKNLANYAINVTFQVEEPNDPNHMTLLWMNWGKNHNQGVLFVLELNAFRREGTVRFMHMRHNYDERVVLYSKSKKRGGKDYNDGQPHHVMVLVEYPSIILMIDDEVVAYARTTQWSDRFNATNENEACRLQVGSVRGCDRNFVGTISCMNFRQS